MPAKISYKQSTDDSRYYEPGSGGSGIVNVVDQMAWTLSPQSSRKDVPRMRLTEYQQSTGQLIASIIYFSRTFQGISTDNLGNKLLGKTDALEVYKNKYFGKKTGFSYILPYFESSNLKRSSSFSGGEDSGLGAITSKLPAFLTNSTIGKALGTVDVVANSIAAAANVLMAGKINFEFPKRWDNTEPESYSTTFDLFNTGTYDDIIANRRFCHLLSYQNTPSRRNFAIIDPPVIYSLVIPGIVDLPVCHIESLEITNLGNIRQMEIDNGTRNIPEAYRITISFRSLLMPTRNIMLATEVGKSVEAISVDSLEFNDKIREMQDFLLNSPDTTETPSTPTPLQRGAMNGGGFSGGGRTDEELFNMFGQGGGGFSGGGQDL